MLQRYRRWSLRREFREGRILTRFIARDIRRDILVISAARVCEGIITGRVRTTNLLYRSKGLAPEPEFGQETELRIAEMWHWTGKPWGGLPDGTSIVGHLPGAPSAAAQAEETPVRAAARATPWVLALLSFLIAALAAWASLWWGAALFAAGTALLAAQIRNSRRA